MGSHTRRTVRIGAAIAVLGASVGGAADVADAQGATDEVPQCGATTGDVELSGTVSADQAKTYELIPFEVAEGTTRVEVGYSWTPVEDTTLDLGLWDADGTSGPKAFRGWGGSRQGRLDKGMDPAWVSEGDADRAFTPGAIEAGTWNVELGLAEIAPAGATWTVLLKCSDLTVGSAPAPDPVDADHVANPTPAWYRGDFHMHSWNSNPKAPTYDEFVDYARAAELDILPVTEYVVTRHQNELGAVQRDNPDLLIWPGREVITYFGHAIVLGETPSTVEYRVGWNGITLGDIQADSVSDGALFGIAHPTVFPEAQFGSLCRGCEFQLDDSIDWSEVTTMELVTNQPLVGDAENPFIQTAIDEWESKLAQGHRLTAVSGSDDKLGPALGSTSTMVFAESLSRADVADALRNGRAYIEVRGAADSPSIDVLAASGDDEAGIGDSLPAERATLTATVTDGVGQTLTVFVDGVVAATFPITSDQQSFESVVERSPDSGPLGTRVRWEVADDRSRTIITNPVFLTDPSVATTTTEAPSTSSPDTSTSHDDANDDDATDGSPLVPIAVIAAIVAVAGAVGIAAGRRRRRDTNVEPHDTNVEE